MWPVMAIIRAQDAHAETVGAALETLARASRQEAGCLRYDLFRSQDGAVFLTQEVWVDEAAAQAHMRTPHVADAIGQAGPLLAAAPEIFPCRALL